MAVRVAEKNAGTQYLWPSRPFGARSLCQSRMVKSLGPSMGSTGSTIAVWLHNAYQKCIEPISPVSVAGFFGLYFIFIYFFALLCSTPNKNSKSAFKCKFLVCFIVVYLHCTGAEWKNNNETREEKKNMYIIHAYVCMPTTSTQQQRNERRDEGNLLFFQHIFIITIINYKKRI